MTGKPCACTGAANMQGGCLACSNQSGLANANAQLSQTPGTSLRARASRELGARFAHLLATLPHSHQLGVCAELRIPWRTHMRWMADDAAEGSDVAEYQAEVMAALAKQRAADLDDIERAVEATDMGRASTIWNVRKHRHESRFKRFYEDAAPTKHEHSGPDGKPIQVDVYAKMSDAQLLSVVTGDAAVPVPALGDGEGGDDVG